MPEDWNLFERLNDQEQAMIFMNTALKETTPLADYNQLIMVVFNMYSLWDKAGSNSQTAQDLFYSLEDKLMLSMQDEELSIYVGRISVQNKMELYFYGRNAVDWEAKLKHILTEFPQFRYYYTVRTDKDWTFYKEEMCPTPLEEQWMRNAKIAYALQRHGDQADTVRQVEHWLHFSDKVSMDEVKGKARTLGFEIMNAELDASKSVNPYVLQLGKKHALDLVTVNEVTKQLFTLATESGGTYDGWGTGLKLKLPARIKFTLLRVWKKKWLLGGIAAALTMVILALLLWQAS